ncbi:hypothetical protein QEN19_003829 [Hanseniaspora menglaensis]
MIAANSIETLMLKVDPESIVFSQTAHITGEEPKIIDQNTKANLLKAAKLLAETSETVAFPTETVYGLGGSSMNDDAVRNIYKAKNRPSDNPLISHISSVKQIDEVIYGIPHDPSNPLKNIPKNYHQLINKLWPGPLTILLPIEMISSVAKVGGLHEAKLSKLTTGNQTTFAVRMPSNNIARALIHYANTPVAAPSANTSTKPSPTSARHVYFDLANKTSIILDGGDCAIGVESTVIDCFTDKDKVLLLRPGGFTKEDIEKIAEREVVVECVLKKDNQGVRTPGMKYKHYAPSCKVVLFSPENKNIRRVLAEMQKRINLLRKEKPILKVGILGYKHLKDIDTETLTLGSSDKILLKSLGGDLKEMQKNIFKELRELDDIEHIDLLFIEGVAEEKEGLAIMNRLSKSAGSDIVNF